MQLQVRTIHKAFALLCCLNASLYLGCNEPVEESEQDAQVQQTDQDGGKLGEINDQIKLASNDPTLYYNKALIHFEKGDLDASFGDINRALSLDSTNNTYLSFMSDVLYFQGDVEAARSFITHWLTIYPGNKEALIKVAKLHILNECFQLKTGHMIKKYVCSLSMFALISFICAGANDKK